MQSPPQLPNPTPIARFASLCHFPPEAGPTWRPASLANTCRGSFGSQFFVENRSGAGGNIGIEASVRSQPDGYTLLFTSDYVASAALISRLNIDPLKDLVPVILVSRLPIALAVHPSLGVNSVAELIALAKQQPGL